VSGSRDFGAADVLDVLRLLDAAGVGCWLDGGWGVDALLGRQTRDHDDLDVVLDREQLGAAQEALRGFAHDPAVEPGPPARLVLVDDRNRQVDLHPVGFDARGNGWQALGEGAWGMYPAAGLTGSGTVAGHPVRCVTAELQLWHHLGYPWDEQDWRDMTALAERFGLELPPRG
jgi:lincosamide nucleotidyltransferase A/C/D/E